MSPSNLRFALILAAGIALAAPLPAKAQQWTPEEEEVLAQIEECFNSWTEASAQNDVDIWVQRCRPSEQSLYWWAPNAGPHDLEGLLRRWDVYFPTIKRATSEGFQPMRIRLVDDKAMVYGYTWWFDEKADGSLEQFHDKRLEVYHRQDGQWRLFSIVWIPVSSDGD